MKHDDYHYRKIYEQNYGPIPVDFDGRTYEIHHIDGNANNNEPSNLIAVSIQEHYNIHYKQGDYSACLIMSERMKISPEEKSELARKFQLDRIEKGLHHFLGGKVQKDLAKRLVEEGTHNFLGGKIQSQSNQKRINNKTHHLLGPNHNKERLEAGTHGSQKKKECPHCGKVCDSINYGRWHGDNCKRKKNEKFL